MLRADHSALRRHADRLGLPLCDAVLRALREITPPGEPVPTLLAVCPNSEAVVKAAVLASKEADAPLCFAATLNQVDLDGGYTGWTQEQFVRLVRNLVEEAGFTGPVVVGLDHGGPWLKDLQSREGWSLPRAMQGVKDSLAACLDAGYDLLHIDPTVDRTLPPGTAMPIELVIERTLELITHAETHRRAQGLPPVSYEVGTEEVHGGLADLSVFTQFLEGLRSGLDSRFPIPDSPVWPCFVVGKVGTDLHTTLFDPAVARELVARAAEYGAVIKGHYTDYVSNAGDYPRAGMGGANVGPEFTEAEYGALEELVRREEALLAQGKVAQPSGKMAALRDAVVASGRWEKWRQPEEAGFPFDQLSPERQGWLVRTGCRYIWADPKVVAARRRLYSNLAAAGEESEEVVLRAIGDAIRKCYQEFGVEGVNGRVERALESA
jgi:D-tagatose-1,6-bisphosphate aldolase subunit GatZ/KbaZ